MLAVAHRLFSEHRTFAVPHCHAGELAKQGVNGATGFTTKVDQAHAIVHRHGEQVERTPLPMPTKGRSSADMRDGAGCLTRPVTERLAILGSHSWHTRFSAQVITHANLTDHEFLASPAPRQILNGLRRCLAGAWPERARKARQPKLHTCVAGEGALAENLLTSPQSARHHRRPHRRDCPSVAGSVTDLAPRAPWQDRQPDGASNASLGQSAYRSAGRVTGGLHD